MEPQYVATIPVKTKYVQEEAATVWLSKYTSDDVWALLITDDMRQPLITATINMSGYGMIPADNHVFIKDYSENEGILRALIQGGIVLPAAQEINAGFASVHECELAFDPNEIWTF